jgi:hypothetical protein
MPVLLMVAAAGIAAGGWVVWHRIAQVQEGDIAQVSSGVARAPATRARGAVISISGEASHPRVRYDPASGTLWVAFQSRYYDPRHALALNRQYLATEGRLVVQLILYDNPELGRVVVALDRGRRTLATVTGTPGEAYDAYEVEYAQPLR